MTTKPCCDHWAAIRPHLGWFVVHGDEGQETDQLVMPVIGPAVAGAKRVNFCPSCGAPTRQATWSVAELREASDA